MPNPFKLSAMSKFTVILMAFTLLLSACGGGASSGKTAAAGNGTILDALDVSTSDAAQTKLPTGADSISMASFWEKQVLNGFTKTGYLKGYAYQDYKNLTLLTTITGNSKDGKSSNLLVIHPDHQAQSGDMVTLSGVSKDFLDMPFPYFNGTFLITGRDSNSYYITVPFASTKRESAPLIANLSYKYKECEGVQTVVQTPALATDPVTYFDGYVARVSKYTVDSSVNGCSPPSSSFTTYKYFAVTNPKPGAALNYPLMGQSVEGGDFASLDKTFDLPTSTVQSGQTGTIGTMKFYKKANKAFLTGTAKLSYEILKYTTNAVFIAIVTYSYNDNYNLMSTMTEVYGRDPSVDKDYKLIRTTVKYNNPRRNEVIIE
jgi:hypothetical protein